MARLIAKKPTDTRKIKHGLDRAFAQATSSLWNGWKGGNMGPKDHTSFTSQEINITQNESNKHESSRNGVKAQKK